ncbi:hypothetical protein [Sphingomonas solaris]|uniref:Fe-S oxidoreductase n=1 Tax=Alterirhizorhabdus solaris TaxID=2529389 RepID=A0A558R1J5_9SPHN|nr:hypothetical protein [Sphingomonas solaris]TVV73229.1 hypothetical protein FOY91_12790 [Sphingomonas solaris]
MKALLIATSLLFGTAAMAQDAPPPGAAGQPMQSDTMPAPADPAMAPPPPAGAPGPGGDMAAPAPADAPAPGMAPPAANAPPPMAMQSGASDPASYPPCSRTVTDKCVNRGRK